MIFKRRKNRVTVMGSLSGRAEQTGILVAAAGVPATFQRTLMPKSSSDQGIVTGIVLGLEYAIAATIQDGIESAALLFSGSDHVAEADDRRWRRTTFALDLAAIGAGLGIQNVFKQRDGESTYRGLARLFGYWTTASAVSGASIAAMEEALDSVDRRAGGESNLRSLPIALPAGVVISALTDFDRRRREAADKSASVDSENVSTSAYKSVGIGVGVTGALAGITQAERLLASGIGSALSMALPGSARFWRPVGHLASLGGFLGLTYLGIHLANKRVEEGEKKMEAAFDQAPNIPEVSGGPGSLVSFESMTKQGRRNVTTVLRPEWIESVMGEPAKAQPIRIFIGLDSAGTEEERVALAMRELERTNAFDRDLLMVISPTGTGYTNYVAVEAAEYLTRGNMASVSMQYAERPSVMSLNKIWEGRHHQRLLFAAIEKRLSDVPANERPRVVAFGESLGAHTSQDAFLHKGTDGLRERDVDHAVWIGTPYASGWKDEVLGPPRPDTDKSLIGVFNDFGQVEALEPEEREKIRYVMITHDNDAVAKFGLDLIVRAPDWLESGAPRPAAIPTSLRWTSPTTFFLTLIDMKNSANVIPGQFEAKGHDYRADLARFIREFYDLDATEDQMARIEEALRQYELARKDWIDQHAPPSKK